MKSAPLIAILTCSLAANAQISETQPSAPAAPVPAAVESTPPAPKNRIVLEDGTPIRLRLNRTVSSLDSHVGDTVDFVVLEDIRVNGTLVVSKGSLAYGTVTEVEPTKRVARGGKLEVNLKYVKLLDGERVTLRAVQGGKGGNHVVAMTMGIVAAGVLWMPAAPFVLLMHGKDMVLPKGAEVTAYVSTAKELDLTRFQPGAMSLASSRGSGVRVIGDADSEKSSESGPPPGFFLHRTYTNQYFALSFPLATDWVPETGAVRNRLASRNPAQSESLLLAAVHIPQDVTDLRADSSFTVTAVTRSAHANTDNCARYLKMWPGKKATLKGTISEYTVAGHEFFRANFDSRTDASDLAVVCSPAGHYLLLWHVQGLYWDSVDDAASTVYAIVPWPPDEETGSSESFQQVTVPRNTSASLLVREVKPVYPAVAIENHIQGTVRMRAAISKDGDVEGLELLDGPVELAMSAVTAVRQWKYRPYLMGGQPVAISTEVVVNYESGPSM